MKVCFSDEEALRRVLAMRTHVIEGYRVKVEGSGGVGQSHTSEALGIVGNRIFIPHLPDGMTQKDLTTYFSGFGEIDDLFVTQKGTCFLSFADPAAADGVLLSERHEVVPGQDVYVERAFAKGGGLSGQKGSKGIGKDSKD